MAATTGPRDTRKIAGDPIPPAQGHPMKTGVTINKGAMVCLNGGYAAPFTAATGLISLGISKETKTNSGANGAVDVEVEPGMYANLVNQSTDLLAQTDAGALCYAYDDQSVGKTAGGARSVAGVFVRLNADGTVKVLMGLGINA